MSSSEDRPSDSPSDSSPSDSSPSDSSVLPSSSPTQNSQVVSSEEVSNFNNEFDDFVLAAESGLALLNPQTIYDLVYNYVKSTTPPDIEYSEFKLRCISTAMIPLLFLSFLMATSLSNNINVMSSREIQELIGGRKRKSGGGGNGKLPPLTPGRGKLPKKQRDFLLGESKKTDPDKYFGTLGDYRQKDNIIVFTDADIRKAEAEAKAEAAIDASAAKEAERGNPADDAEKATTTAEEDSLQRKLKAAGVVEAQNGPNGRRKNNTKITQHNQLSMMQIVAVAGIFGIVFAPYAAAVNHQTTPGYKRHTIEIKNPYLSMSQGSQGQIVHQGPQNVMGGLTAAISATAGLIAHQTVGIHAVNRVAAEGINFLHKNVKGVGPSIASAIAPYVGVVPTTELTMSPAAVVLGQNREGKGINALMKTGTADNQPVTYMSEIELAARNLAEITQYCAQGKGTINVDPKKCSFAYFEQLQQRLYRAIETFPALLRDLNAKYLDLMGKKCGIDMKVGKKIIVPARPAVMSPEPSKWNLWPEPQKVLQPATDARLDEVQVPCFDPLRDAFNVDLDENGKLVFLISDDVTLAKVASHLQEDKPEQCPIVDYNIVTGNMITYKENIERYIVDFVKNPKLKTMIEAQGTPELQKKTVVKMFNKCLMWQFNLDAVTLLPDLIKELSDPNIFLNVKKPTDVPRPFMDENAAISLFLEQFRSFENIIILTEEEAVAEKAKQAELEQSLGKAYVPPIVPLERRITSQNINDIYTEYWKAQTLSAKFANNILRPTLDVLGDIIVTTVDVTSKVVSNSAGKVVKNVGAEFGLEGWQASLAGMSVFGIIGAAFGMVPFVGAAVPIGFGASWLVLKMVQLLRYQIRGGGRFIGAAVRGAIQPGAGAGGAGGCIRRNARSGGGGTKRKKIKTKIVKSKKRRLIYFTRRRSIIKKIRRSKKN
jgi:hypothetical protein